MDIELIKRSYEQALAGTYDPALIDAAYKSLTGNEEPVAVRMKKAAIYSFMNNIYPTLDHDKTDLAVEPNNGSDLNPTHTEEVVLEKPNNKNKKTVSRRGRKPKTK